MSSICIKMDSVDLNNGKEYRAWNDRRQAAQWEIRYQTGMINKHVKYPPHICCGFCKKPFHFRRNCPEKNRSSEFSVQETYNTKFDDTWVASLNRKHHASGNKRLFKNFINSFGVETHVFGYKRQFFRGRGSVYITCNGQKYRIDNVYYVPTLKKNVLSIEHLSKQGFEMKFENGMCHISRPKKRTVGIACWICNSEEHAALNCPMKQAEAKGYEPDSERTSTIASSVAENEEQASNTLYNHFEALSLEAEKNESRKDEGKTPIVYPKLVSNLEDCMTFIDLIHIVAKVEEHKCKFEEEFDVVVKWFVKDFLKIRTEAPIPPKDPYGHPINLLDLYLNVEKFGGLAEVNMKDCWDRIAFEMGYSRDKENVTKEIVNTLHITYLRYLEMLIWYHDKYQGKELIIEEGTKAAESKRQAEEEDHMLPIKKRKVADRDWPAGCGPCSPVNPEMK